MLACLMVAGFAACGDDDSGSTDGSSGSQGTAASGGSDGESGSTTSAGDAKPPKPIPLSEDAKRAGSRDCRDVAPVVALRRFAARARKDAAEDVAATRKQMLAQARRLREAGPAASAGAAPIAAALYAISQPRTERSGAYQGCLAELVKTAQAESN